jgi:hypothetical protein
MVNAFLELLPMMPRTQSNSELVEALIMQRLPPVLHERWEVRARRGLVERLLELVAEGGDEGWIDHAAAQLARSYAGRASSRPLAAEAREEGGQVPVERSAALVWRRWRDGAGPYSESAPMTIERIDRMRSARLELASGPVQVFAAQQVGIAELMAYTVASERPGDGRRIGLVLERMNAKRSAAPHVFGQIAAVEAAMLELWAIRLGSREDEV